MKKYIIFDFDGTLANSKHVTTKILEELAEEHHFPKVGPNQIALLQEKAESVEQFQMIAGQFYQKFKEALPEVQLFSGISEMLLDLHNKGFRLAVISSNEESNIRTYFQSQGLDFISEIYTSSNLLGKDAMIEEFCKKHQLQRDEVIYVGDEVRDYKACQKTEIDMIFVRWGFGEEELVQAIYYADTPADIIKYAICEKEKKSESTL